MKTRNVTLTLAKAKEFYNSGNEALKEIALQAFSEQELTIPEWQNIKTFRDACDALDIPCSIESDLTVLRERYFEGNTGDHLVAIYKLDIIHKALNKGWKPSLVEGHIYYPYVKFYPSEKAKHVVFENITWCLGKTFIADGQKYTLVGGDCSSSSYDGLAYFGYGYGNVYYNLGLLGCKSTEIAKHMSRYFSKEIFEACYSQYVKLFEWC